jgi:alpha-1,6-mannosyltransferase
VTNAQPQPGTEPEPEPGQESGTGSGHRGRGLRTVLPDLGPAGSRSALLHDTASDAVAARFPEPPHYSVNEHHLFTTAVFTGTLGCVLVGIGGVGAGAVPVVENSLWELPVIGFLSRLLHATTVTVFIGIALLCLGWVLLWRYCAPGRDRDGRPLRRAVPLRTVQRIAVAWVIPLLFTAPMFTQDIYSYLAQGAIAGRGMDPYSAGPVDLLGVDDPLARSVPYVWSHSPAPYGPVAVGLASLISHVTGDTIGAAVILHRLLAVAGIVLTGWALIRLSRRCGVDPAAALWLGILNPLVLLHLVAGVHNEAIMLGLLLPGVELALRATDPGRTTGARWWLGTAGILLICGAGLVKVTAFLALGFTGVALARFLGGRIRDLVTAAVLHLVAAVVSVVALCLVTGLGFGWIFVQGGASEVISWMSATTDLGLLSTSLGESLGLGDHRDAALTTARAVGVLVGAFWVVRMLWASFRGRIHPVGGLGVAMFFLVIFFPVVHPWYVLWAVIPLAAWADRRAFRIAVVLYSVILSFFILPRGLNLPPGTVAVIYLMSVVFLAVVLVVGWSFYRRRRPAD